MTAEDIIAQIKAMPPSERAKVIGFIHELHDPDAHLIKPDERRFKEAVEWVFSEHGELLRRLSQ